MLCCCRFVRPVRFRDTDDSRHRNHKTNGDFRFIASKQTIAPVAHKQRDAVRARVDSDERLARSRRLSFRASAVCVWSVGKSGRERVCSECVKLRRAQTARPHLRQVACATQPDSCRRTTTMFGLCARSQQRHPSKGENKQSAAAQNDLYFVGTRARQRISAYINHNKATRTSASEAIGARYQPSECHIVRLGPVPIYRHKFVLLATQDSSTST